MCKMLHVQCLKQKGPGHLRNVFHAEHVTALEVLEILSYDPVTNYCSEEKKSRKKGTVRKFYMQDWFPLRLPTSSPPHPPFNPCVGQSLLQTCMRKQMLHILVCFTDPVPTANGGSDYLQNTLVFSITCKFIRLCYIVISFSNIILILLISYYWLVCWSRLPVAPDWSGCGPHCFNEL